MNKLEGEQDKYLPTVIHVIWAGGGTTLFDDGMNNLAKWAYANPNFKIILWVDDKVVPPEMSLADMQELYVKQFTEAYLKLADQEESISEIRTRIDVKSIREDKVCPQEQDAVDYAIDRLDPNYGLSSDLLRYRILHKYGGFYFDVTDVIPGGSKNLNILNSIPYANFGKINEAHKLYVDHLSQTQNPSATDLKTFDLRAWDFTGHTEEENEKFLAQSRVGNDSFLCTKGNPLVQLMIEETERRLLCRTINEKIMMAYGGFNKKDMTLDLSGPNTVKIVVYGSKTGTLTKNKKLKVPGYYKKISAGSAKTIMWILSRVILQMYQKTLISLALEVF